MTTRGNNRVVDRALVREAHRVGEQRTGEVDCRVRDRAAQHPLPEGVSTAERGADGERVLPRDEFCVTREIVAATELVEESRLQVVTLDHTMVGRLVNATIS